MSPTGAFYLSDSPNQPERSVLLENLELGWVCDEQCICQGGAAVPTNCLEAIPNGKHSPVAKDFAMAFLSKPCFRICYNAPQPKSPKLFYGNVKNKANGWIHASTSALLVGTWAKGIHLLCVYSRFGCDYHKRGCSANV